MVANQNRGIEGALAPVHGRLQDVVKNGFEPVGWEGDPHLEVHLDRKSNDWLVIDTISEPYQVVVRKKVDGLRDLDFRSLCERLKAAQFKGQGAESIVNRVIARNEAVEASKSKLDPAQQLERADKLAFALVGKRLF